MKKICTLSITPHAEINRNFKKLPFIRLYILISYLIIDLKLGEYIWYMVKNLKLKSINKGFECRIK